MEPRCQQCGGALIEGVNSDFCTERCEQEWIAWNTPFCAECGKPVPQGVQEDFCCDACQFAWEDAHTWPCDECDDEGMVDGYTLRGRRVRSACPNCNGDMSYVDNALRRCAVAGCREAALAGQVRCHRHIAVAQEAAP